MTSIELNAIKWYGILMIFPVYRTDLSPEQLDSYYTRMHESDLPYSDACFGTIAVGGALELGANPYRLGESPSNPEIIRTYDIVDVSHIISASKEAPDEQGEVSPALRPYEEDPVSLRARGVYRNKRYAIAGVYYASNKLVGWMNIMPERGLYRILTPDEEESFFE